MVESEMIVGGFYGFTGQKEILVFIGNIGSWYQFELHDEPDSVWAEVLGDDLYMIENRD